MFPAYVSLGAMLLLQGMRHEYEAVQAAKGAQDSEMRAMKERMMLGVSFQWPVTYVVRPPFPHGLDICLRLLPCMHASALFYTFITCVTLPS